MPHTSPPTTTERAPSPRRGQSVNQCIDSPPSNVAALHLGQSSRGVFGTQTHNPLAPTRRIKPRTPDTSPKSQQRPSITPLVPSQPWSICKGATSPISATDLIYRASVGSHPSAHKLPWPSQRSKHVTHHNPPLTWKQGPPATKKLGTNTKCTMVVGGCSRVSFGVVVVVVVCLWGVGGLAALFLDNARAIH